MELATLLGRLAVADRNHRVGLFDEAIDDQRWPAHKRFVLYLPIERVLAREMPVSGEIPDDVVGQAAEDLVVIAPAEPLEIRFDDLFVWRHGALSVSARATIVLQPVASRRLITSYPLRSEA